MTGQYAKKSLTKKAIRKILFLILHIIFAALKLYRHGGIVLIPSASNHYSQTVFKKSTSRASVKGLSTGISAGTLSYGKLLFTFTKTYVSFFIFVVRLQMNGQTGGVTWNYSWKYSSESAIQLHQ